MFASLKTSLVKIGGRVKNQIITQCLQYEYYSLLLLYKHMVCVKGYKNIPLT